MMVYHYRGDLYCSECGTFIRSELEPSDDSEKYPQGPYDNGGGESDFPHHCDSCGYFLQNPLTPEGLQFVQQEANKKHYGGDLKGVVKGWADFYGIKADCNDE